MIGPFLDERGTDQSVAMAAASSVKLRWLSVTVTQRLVRPCCWTTVPPLGWEEVQAASTARMVWFGFIRSFGACAGMEALEPESNWGRTVDPAWQRMGDETLKTRRPKSWCMIHNKRLIVARERV